MNDEKRKTPADRTEPLVSDTISLTAHGLRLRVHARGFGLIYDHTIPAGEEWNMGPWRAFLGAIQASSRPGRN